MSVTKKLYFISGEASGDLHGSNLIKEMMQQVTSEQLFEVRFWGGDKMAEAIGKAPVKHYKELAFMGFLEVVLNLRTILKNIDFCKSDILQFKPDVLVLIDYPGFNLRIAEWAKNQGVKVVYYISPTVWAWKEKRVFTIKKAVDRMYVILPFEKPFYEKFDYEVEYYGHPLLDAVYQFELEKSDSDDFISSNKLSQLPIIAILPGSRKQEIRKKLPVMLEAVSKLEGYQFIIAGAPGMEADFYNQFIEKSNTTILFGATYQLLNHSEAAIVTSGTATLETALFNVPQVVCYKTSSISYHIAKRLVNIKYISLANLILDKEVNKELIQHECTVEAIQTELKEIIKGGSKREKMLADYKTLRTTLGEGGASHKIASSLVNYIFEK